MKRWYMIAVCFIIVAIVGCGGGESADDYLKQARQKELEAIKNKDKQTPTPVPSSWKLVTEKYDSGEKQAEGYIDGENKKAGDWKYFHKNGKVQQEGKYYNGNMNGLWKIYYESGKKDQEMTFGNLGGLHGEWKKWHENGQLGAVVQYVNSKETFGKYYDEDGQETTKEEWQAKYKK